MNEMGRVNSQNKTERYSNKDQSKSIALFGYVAIALCVLAAVILVILFGIPGYFYA